MNNLLISLLIGLVAAVIDVTPMIIKKVDKFANISAFCAWIVLGIFIPRINLIPIIWLNGIIVALLFVLPVIILVFKQDKKGIIPIIIMTIILGCGVGFFSKLLLG